MKNDCFSEFSRTFLFTLFFRICRMLDDDRQLPSTERKINVFEVWTLTKTINYFVDNFDFWFSSAEFIRTSQSTTVVRNCSSFRVKFLANRKTKSTTVATTQLISTFTIENIIVFFVITSIRFYARTYFMTCNFLVIFVFIRLYRNGWLWKRLANDGHAFRIFGYFYCSFSHQCFHILFAWWHARCRTLHGKWMESNRDFFLDNSTYTQLMWRRTHEMQANEWNFAMWYWPPHCYSFYFSVFGKSSEVKLREPINANDTFVT